MLGVGVRAEQVLIYMCIFKKSFGFTVFVSRSPASTFQKSVHV